MGHTIETTCILTDNQLTRLHTITETIKTHSQNGDWTEQMTLQLAVGNTHMTEMILIMLEGYIEENIKKKHP